MKRGLGDRAWVGLSRTLLAAVLLVNWLLFPGCFNVTRQDGRFFGNMIAVLSRGPPVAILAIGMTMVIATKGVDLSVGAVMAICGATAAVMVTSGYPPPGWPCWPRCCCSKAPRSSSALAKRTARRRSTNTKAMPIPRLATAWRTGGWRGRWG